MDKTAWLKVGFDTVVILNALAIICWIFLAIFPGIYHFSQGDIEMGFQLMILNFWFYFFVGTLIGALILHFLLEESKDTAEKTSV
jgi:membrane protein DedA with SNARE-associated domain